MEQLMKSVLQEIVAHTTGLGIIELVKVTGTKDSTKLNAMAEDKSVVMESEFKNTIPEFEGIFGMPNLPKLDIILGIPEYKENEVVQIVRQKKGDNDLPVCIHFNNQAGDFENEYRLMSTEIVSSKVPGLKFQGANWDVTISPSQSSIQKMKFQAQANSDEKVFMVKTDKINLKFYFGDHSTHAGSFIFEHNVTGKLKNEFSYPVQQVMNILSLNGDKLMQFSDKGVIKITIDSGLAKHEYLVPAQVK